MLLSRGYDQKFYESISSDSKEAAHHIIPILKKLIPISSVVDIGCAGGDWLKACLDFGIEDICGLDSYSQIPESLKISSRYIINQNLNESFQLEKKYSLSICLELAEHLQPDSSSRFISDLCATSDFILFSAAPPGQGGVSHSNEKDLEYWRSEFLKHEFTAFDPIRPQIMNVKTIAPWYRYNTLLYIRKSAISVAPAELKITQVSEREKIKIFDSYPWRIRKLILRRLPVFFVGQMASLKHSLTRIAGKF